jgi:transcriptional regulator with XRE-family HTH domain
MGFGKTPPKSLGELIKSQRLSRHWSTKSLQTKAYISATSLWEIENNKVIPSIKSACKMADAFDIDIKVFTDWVIKLEIQKYTQEYYQCFKTCKNIENYSKNVPVLGMKFQKGGETFRTKMVKASQWLKNKRIEAKKTLQQIENETGILCNNFRHMEAGDRSIPLKAIFCLSKCLSFNPEDLLHIIIQEVIQQYIKWTNDHIGKYILNHKKNIEPIFID